jgi:hypothetical protein
MNGPYLPLSSASGASLRNAGTMVTSSSSAQNSTSSCVKLLPCAALLHPVAPVDGPATAASRGGTFTSPRDMLPQPREGSASADEARFFRRRISRRAPPSPPHRAAALPWSMATRRCARRPAESALRLELRAVQHLQVFALVF